MNPQLEELATLYVLDRLEPGERTAFESQLLRSPELATLVHELETALTREIHSLPQHAPPADLLARVESRLDSTSAPAADGAAAPSSRSRRDATGALPSRTAAAGGSVFPWLAVARWGIAAVIAVSVATLAVQSLRRSPAPAAPPVVPPVVLVFGLDSQGSALTRMPLPPAAGGSAESFVQLASLAENLWENPNKLPVAPPAASESAHGYALFDPDSNQGFIAIRHLPALAPGHRYYVWIADLSSRRITEAGVLPATNASSGLYSFAVASPEKEKSARLNLFITAEDASTDKPSAPHGKVVLGNKEL
ncbi:MAG TPA: hypothetical protein VG710_11890 [Opitutus sp.]|nr:hypothetical protein [Opitutus sp.]